MKISLCILVFVIICVPSCTNMKSKMLPLPVTTVVSSAPSGNITSGYTFLGGSGNEDIRSIHQTSDGGYIIVGRADADIPSLQGKTPLNPFSTGADMLVVKLDSTGNTAWYTFLGSSGIDYGQSIQQTADGGYIVAGYVNKNIASLQGKTPLNPYSSDYDILVVKLDTTGNTDWYTFLGGSGGEYGFPIRQTADGGYIVTGNTYANIASLQGKTPLNPFSGGADILVVKLDSTGNTDWYTFLGDSGAQFAYSMQQTADGGYIVAGSTSGNIASLQGKTSLNPYTGSGEMLVVKLDSTGNTAWYTFLGGSGIDYAYSIQQTADGGYIITGSAEADIPSLQGKTPLNPFSGGVDMLVVKLDSTGNTAWYTLLGGSGTDYARSIQQTADGGYIVAGYAGGTIASLQGTTPRNPYSSGFDMLVVKLDSTGNTDWYTFIGGSGNDYAYSIRQTADGGYIVAGYAGQNIASLQGKTPLNPYSSNNDMLVVKLAPDGNIIPSSW